ncbi:MAG: hypothetical protein AAGD25_06610 [Cyanobacteria bacterium P01_F01_bin.150]
MKLDKFCVIFVGGALLLGIITPADFTETLKGMLWTGFQAAGVIDKQVESSNEEVKERDRPWNQKVKVNINE